VAASTLQAGFIGVELGPTQSLIWYKSLSKICLTTCYIRSHSKCLVCWVTKGAEGNIALSSKQPHKSSLTPHSNPKPEGIRSSLWVLLKFSACFVLTLLLPRSFREPLIIMHVHQQPLPTLVSL